MPVIICLRIYERIFPYPLQTLKMGRRDLKNPIKDTEFRQKKHAHNQQIRNHPPMVKNQCFPLLALVYVY